MTGRFDRPVERALRLLAGLVLFGLAMALLLESRTGLDPWNVFHQGVGEHTGLTIGQVTVISSLALLALWIPLRQRPGLGTVANALVVGPVVDLGIAWIPTANGTAEQAVFMVVAILASALATGLYVGAGWGPGPRDGLMTGLHLRTGRSIRLVRTAIEVSVLAAGVALGGSAGVGTVVYALSIGPLAQFFLRICALPEPPAAPADAPAHGTEPGAPESAGVGEPGAPAPAGAVACETS
jgi:uncharacterized membrane protein YczE